MFFCTVGFCLFSFFHLIGRKKGSPRIRILFYHILSSYATHSAMVCSTRCYDVWAHINIYYNKFSTFALNTLFFLLFLLIHTMYNISHPYRVETHVVGFVYGNSACLIITHPKIYYTYVSVICSEICFMFSRGFMILIQC